MSDSMPILEVKKLSHVYSPGTPLSHTALENVNLQVKRGEILGIIGETGSGKSTLIQHFNGLLKPTQGQVLLEGRDIFSSHRACEDARFKVGLVFQYPEYQLFEETLFDDIAFGPRNKGLREQEVKNCVLEAADFVGLAESDLSVSPFELSGGQKRRCAIAGVIAMEPDILILDEPTAGLDPVGIRQIMGNVLRYHEEKKATVVLVSHSMEEIAEITDRIAVLDHGKIVLLGTPKEVFTQRDTLSSLGLSLPFCTEILCRLASRGIPVDTSLYTFEDTVNSLARLLGNEGRDCPC